MRMQRKFTIGLIQMASTPDPEENLRRAESCLKEAADQGAEVICLPELFRSQYFCQREDAALFDLAEPVPGPTTEALGRIAREKQVVVIAPIFERRAAGVYHNSAAIIDANGEVAGIYRKMHIPDDPGYYEKFYFTPGDLGFRAFDTRVGRIAILICWDQWYPEGRVWRRFRARAFCSIPPRLAGTRTRRSSTAAHSVMRGGRSNAATPSPTECMWRRSTEWVLRSRLTRRERGWNSGGRHSSPIPSAWC